MTRLEEKMTRTLNQPSLRMLIVGIIVLLMLIPLAFVSGVVDERQAFADEVYDDIAQGWGYAQHVAGPFIVIPEIHRIEREGKDGERKWFAERRERVYLPEALKADIEIVHQLRSRAIYTVPVYEARVRLEGSFALNPPESDRVRPLLDEAVLVLGISQTQAISEMSPLVVAGNETVFAAGTDQEWLGRGVHAPLKLEEGGLNPVFEIAAVLKGTRTFNISPVGAASDVSIGSDWPHPSFKGMYLPDQYTLAADGFEAHWKVHELARDMPAQWLVYGYEPDLQNVSAEVMLFEPVTSYTVVERGIKYGILFIGLTYLTFACFEMLTPIRFHFVQYGVVGAALVLFYLAVLSLSEHIAFGVSYALATTLASALIGCYVWMMTRAAKLAAWATSVLVVLYASLFVLLKLEAFALLVGTAILFVGLGALMFATRGLTESTQEA